jgi:His/Glu/Gln/Arg/opine family amino acid ABC transporter permease subunit
VLTATFFTQMLPVLGRGAVTTIELTFASMGLTLVLGLVAALGRLSRFFLFRWTAYWYIEIIRGTPLLVQLFLIYFGLPQYGIILSPFVAAWLGLSINYGAYLAEVYRAGILSIARGQWEAAATIGLPDWKALRLVILPQAIRVVIPPIGNYFISMLKDSALASTISVYELLRAGDLKVAQTFRAFDIYLMVAGYYFVMSYPISLVLHRLEARQAARA